VKYKNIDNAIHNLGHSFMSAMNYFDDDYVMDEVHALVRREPHEVWINFSTGEVLPSGEHSARFLKSVAHYRNQLAEHFLKHQVDATALSEVRLHHRLTRKGFETAMHAHDDRGVDHHVIVRNTA
jgi:hypothetical protein